MPKNLLIVESPTKAKTLNRYLGKEYRIMASVGHIKDLPKNKLGVDTEKDFQPDYTVIKGKGKILKEIKKAGREVENIFLAPDPDREGEAIAWHIAHELKNEGKNMFRILINEFTSRAIKEALNSPQELNQDRFESQQTRRILDRLVGYQLSPLLWTKVKRGLSAGRVQSVALRIICDREREIHAFESKEYWSLTADLQSDEPPPFQARLFKINGEKADLTKEQDVRAVISDIEKASFHVEKVARKKKKRNPPPPFTTSLLQQDAYKKLRFPAKKTMFLAQNLYEGIELGHRGQVGLITYMRTDSFRLSDESVQEARKYIQNNFGSEYIPEKPNFFRSRKGAQEAHEAIRPTSGELSPGDIASYLTKDQLALYRLIWKRFIACQMSPALVEQTQADIVAGNTLFRASGSVILFKGFTALYSEQTSENESKRKGEALLPSLTKGQALKLLKLDPAQHFTQPPPRFTEATLIKELEENGIGRPSTYASIMANIRGREYVKTEKGRFIPTELGFLVIDLLVKSFPEILDVAFTAQMENNLDKIENGNVKWTKILHKFYGPFTKELEIARNEMEGAIQTANLCPQSGHPLNIKSGKHGLFLGCSAYPDCTYTVNYRRDEKGRIIPEENEDVGKVEGVCDQCGKDMIIKNGRYGPFLACSGYPDCKNTRTLDNGNTPFKTDIACPEKGCPGKLVERFSKKGKKFFACNQYPRCTFIMWNTPVSGSCPICGTEVLELKTPKRSDPIVQCREKGCPYTQSPIPSKESSEDGGVTRNGEKI